MNTLISVLLLVAVAASAPTGSELKHYHNLLKLTTPLDDPANNLLWDFMKAAGKYLCAIGDDDCDIFSVLSVEELLEEDDLNCDETPDKDVCVTARKLVGDPDLPHDELQDALIAQADRSPKMSTKISKWWMHLGTCSLNSSAKESPRNVRR